MDKSTRSIGAFRLIAVCTVVMLAVPFGLRLLSDRFLPQDRDASRSATEKLQDLFGDGRVSLPAAETLLRRPVAEWTDQQKAAEPELQGWLAAHMRQILPWEWSEAATGKDTNGYRRAWHDLYGELDALCATGRKPLAKRMGLWKSELQARAEHVGRITNQLDRLQVALSSRSIPVEVEVETLERGWLWGFNRKARKRRIGTLEALGKIVDGEAAKAKSQTEQISRLKRNLQAAEVRVREIDELQARLAEADKAGSNDVSVVISVVRRCYRSEPAEK